MRGEKISCLNKPLKISTTSCARMRVVRANWITPSKARGCFSSNPVYAGYVGAPKWDVSLLKGHHEALISYETLMKIQDRINGKARTPTRKAELAKVNQQVEQFLDRIADATVPSVIAAYEARIKKLEDRKIVLMENVAKAERPVRSFDETVRTALDFLASPWKLWASIVWKTSIQP